MWLGVLCSAVVGLAACGNDSSCGAPSQTEYSCQPLAQGSAGGCTGGPKFQTLPQPDPDKTFPLGCTATLPLCSTYRSPQTCTCSQDMQTPSRIGWQCPI